MQGISARYQKHKQRSAAGSVSGQIRQSTVRLKVLAPIEPERFVSDVAQAEPVADPAEAPWGLAEGNRRSSGLPVLVSTSFWPLCAPWMPQIYVGTWHDFYPICLGLFFVDTCASAAFGV